MKNTKEQIQDIIDSFKDDDSLSERGNNGADSNKAKIKESKLEDVKIPSALCFISDSNEASPKPKAKKKPRKPTIVVNVLNTEYDVIKDVLKGKLHYRLVYDVEDEKNCTVGDWDLYWHDLIITPEMLSKMKSYQKVNHFPGIHCIARKNLLGKNLMKMKRLFPKEYNFFPQTWMLPLEWNDFKKQFNSKVKTFIVKPEALSQGQGIFLTRDWNSIKPDEHCVVQRYLNKPFLIEGLKFDLRIYILIYGCDPYRIFIYKEGLARLATEPYTAPSFSNMDNLYIHLTNYAINKNNENFEFNTDAEKADVGHKRSLDFVWRYIDKIGGDSKKVQSEIRLCILKTFFAVQPLMTHSYRSCQPNDLGNNMCFEILGFDILLDHKLKPWLLEVNHAPSFSTDTPFDYKIKSELLADAFKILRMDPMKKIKFEKKKQEQQQMRFSLGRNAHIPRLTKEERMAKKQKKMQKRDAYEEENKGGFTRIFPDKENESLYGKYIEEANSIWEEFTGSKKKVVPPKKEEKKMCDSVKQTKYKGTPYIEKVKKPSTARAMKSPVKVSRTLHQHPHQSLVAPPIINCANAHTEKEKEKPNKSCNNRRDEASRQIQEQSPSIKTSIDMNCDKSPFVVSSICINELPKNVGNVRNDVSAEIVNVLRGSFKSQVIDANNKVSQRERTHSTRCEIKTESNNKSNRKIPTHAMASTIKALPNQMEGAYGGFNMQRKVYNPLNAGYKLVNPSFNAGVFVVPKMLEFVPFGNMIPQVQLRQCNEFRKSNIPKKRLNTPVQIKPY